MSYQTFSKSDIFFDINLDVEAVTVTDMVVEVALADKSHYLMKYSKQVKEGYTQSGLLEIDGDTFRFRIPTEDTTSAPVGIYFISVYYLSVVDGTVQKVENGITPLCELIS